MSCRRATGAMLGGVSCGYTDPWMAPAAVTMLGQNGQGPAAGG
jgi:hypothetical protein